MTKVSWNVFMATVQIQRWSRARLSFYEIRLISISFWRSID